MFARELRTAEDASTGASRGLVADAWPPRLAFFAQPPRGISARDVEWTLREIDTRDTTLPSRKTYFVPHFRAASTNAWTLPSGVGWSTP